MHTTLPKRTVVLLGIGHTNAHVLRMWRMKPIEDAQLICVSNRSKASYSGMLPGVLAGQYSVERMEIDLVRLCASAGARLIVDEVTGIDLDAHQLLFKNRPGLPFDALSIGIGSVPSQTDALTNGEDTVLPIKPMQTFMPRLHSRITELVESQNGPIRIAVVGAGVGGTEISFCLPARLKRWFPEQDFQLTLVTASTQVAKGCIPSTVRLVEQELASRNIEILTGQRVTSVQEGRVTFADNSQREVDLAIWATGAIGPPLLSKLGLETDDGGFLLTKQDLTVLGNHPIFAVGDTGTLQSNPTPKAGVYAVRQGPVLWNNIRQLLAGKPLESFRPQRNFLVLLNLGDGRAIAQYLGRSVKARWCWWLKDFIDGKFMDKYQDYQPMEMKTDVSDKPAMRCAGCGGKIGGSTLSRVLERLDVPQNEHVLVGLDEPDDAAIIQSPGGRPVTVTVDFFTAPLDDPYIVGRIAALNSASDVFAIGSKPIAALALVTIPFGSPRRQEQILYETLAGSLHEFLQMGASLAGGHTIEGPTLTVGFTVLADQGLATPRMKRSVREGDQLILTKPLGSGILLAGHMQARCRAEWMDELVETMLLSNQHAAAVTEDVDIPGLTDVTGFGLAGHLLEMLKPAGLSAKIRLDAVPLLAGTADLLAEGIESTLAPANRDAEQRVQVSEKQRTSPAYAALFDPQTCGGLLLGVAPPDVDRVLQELASQSNIQAAVIGEISAAGSGSKIDCC